MAPEDQREGHVQGEVSVSAPAGAGSLGPYDFGVPREQPWLAPFFRAVSDHLELADQVLKAQPATRLPRSRVRTLAKLALIRGRLSLRSGQLLVMFGQDLDAQVHARPIVEWASLIGFITRDPTTAESLARRRFAFDAYVAPYRMALSAQVLGVEGATPERVRTMQQRYERAERIFHFPGRDVWTKGPFADPDKVGRALSIGKMAKLAGFERMYRTTYSFGSDAVHASLVGIVNQLNGKPDHAFALVALANAFDGLLTCVDGVLNLGLGERLTRVRTRIDQLVREHVERLEQAGERPATDRSPSSGDLTTPAPAEASAPPSAPRPVGPER